MTIETINYNDTFRKYNYSSLITHADDQEACSIIESIIDSGNYFENSPLYQTKENVFARTESIWLKYRMTFLTSVFLYLGKEHKVANMMAWSFMTNNETQADRDTLWHHHAKHGGKGLSGIYYLKIPFGSNWDTVGTEMAPNGVDSPARVWVEPSVCSWLIYPSEIWHRPGIITTNEYRYILAADIVYE
jgi:hypothetical protein